ncbi:hypothetical protein [Rhizobium binxianense]|uniref:hypothetical protein n=1 Tax=Rhizobium binxianense TaxID=3024242 RepID=UPI002361BDC1|nr:hypothetical protein [Rhizobium sp. MJ37]MDC9837859.1 hypothetical protein [Rhizobium sp. MJ37]
MEESHSNLPDDVDALRAIIAAQADQLAEQARKLQSRDTLIDKLKAQHLPSSNGHGSARPPRRWTDEYGVSRPTYYQAKVNFDMAGIAGLVPTKPGPRGPHKIDDKVLAFLQAQLAPGEPVRARELAKLLRQELDIELHPRSIERVLKKSGT